MNDLDLQPFKQYIKNFPDTAIAQAWAEMLIEIEEFDAEYTREDFDAAAMEATLEERQEQLEWEESVDYE